MIEGNYFSRFGNNLKLQQVIGPGHPYKCNNYRQKANYLIGLVKDAGAQIIVSRPELGGINIMLDTDPH
jgi:hypothetical protein